jgi:hypothetical protein
VKARGGIQQLSWKIQEVEKTNGGFEETVQINNDFSQREV